MQITNWIYQRQADAEVQIFEKCFDRGWKMQHRDLNMHWTSIRNIPKANQGAEKWKNLFRNKEKSAGLLCNNRSFCMAVNAGQSPHR